MITTLTDTTSSQVDKKLIEMREAFGANALGRVLTLLLIAGPEDLDEPLQAAVQASHEHPCRVIVLQTEPDAQSDGVDAEIRVGRDAGAGEIVILRVRGKVTAALDTLVTPLLLPDAPIVAWWPSNPPSCPSRDVLGSIAQRRITDSRGTSDPRATLERLRRGYRSGDTDLAWSRITKWRGLVASAYEIPPVTSPQSITVEGDPNDPSVLLMAAWLEQELGTPAQVDPSGEGAHGLSAVSLHREDGDLVLRREDDESMVMNLPGDTTDQHVTLPRRSLFECLSEELRRLDADPVYAEVLCHAFTGIEDPSSFAADKPEPTRVISPDADALVQDAAGRITEHLTSAIQERGVAHLVLTGGSVGIATAGAIAQRLRDAEADTSALEIWWGDERFVAGASSDRNDEAVRESFLEALGIPEHRVHRMPASDSGMSLDEAAAWYGQQLDLAGGDFPFHTKGTAFFDVVLLGMGPDGHVASLFPEHPCQRDTSATAIGVTQSPKPPSQRVSLSWPALNSARHVELLVAGQEKADAVARAQQGIDPWICPASAVRGLESTTWHLDEAAASKL